MKYKELLIPFNPWWSEPKIAFEKLPMFQRPIFIEIYRGLKEIPQIISITGPRRVGKSTLIKQSIQRLLSEGIPAENLIYYSMDDPALLRSGVDRDVFFDELMESSRKRGKQSMVYVFLDEIQKFAGWELYLKKYYDLHYPIRFLVSGSASSPIFKKSRESLLGRIKDYHLLPFSFREFLLYQHREQQETLAQLNAIFQTGEALMDMFSRPPEYTETDGVPVPLIPQELQMDLKKNFERFLLDGGFPEVWTLPDWQTKQSYLFDNQVEKVIAEDLVLAVELRKPELLKRFYISLLERPGREINLLQMAKELSMSRTSIEKYFPLLEMTDLTRRVEKFSKSSLKVRRGNIKCYLVDLALRNAVLRIKENIFEIEDEIGLYAENLVFNALKKWHGALRISYFREKEREVDFILHLGAGRYIPIEVKYRNQIRAEDFKNLQSFRARYRCPLGLAITKNWADFGLYKDVFRLPLLHFLLLFD